MSTRTRLAPHAVATNQSMAASFNSQVTVLQSASGCSYEAVWSGTSPVGTLSVQVSNDYALNSVGNQGNAGNWVTLTLQYNGSAVTSVPVTGNSGTAFIDIEKTQAYAIQLVYTASSGTGTMTATINGKVS